MSFLPQTTGSSKSNATTASLAKAFTALTDSVRYRNTRYASAINTVKYNY
jgi:hypothetical protein